MSGGQNYQQLIEGLKKPLSIDQFKSLSQKYTIIDTRLEGQKTGLIKGSYWFPGEAIHYSWLTPIINSQQPYLCVCDCFELNQVIERFILMGYFNCKGYNNFNLKHYEGQMEYPILRNWKELGDTERKQFVDVRTPWQWNKTGVVKGTMLIQLKNLDRGSQDKLNILKQIQHKKLIVINCRLGQRATLAASILLRHGINCVALIQYFDDIPKFGIKIQTVEQNKQNWIKKGDKLGETSSEDENKAEKQHQTDNINRMAIEECYENCLNKHSQKSHQECCLQCLDNPSVKKPKETIKMQHSFNKNQFQARKQGIIPSKKQYIRFSSLNSFEQVDFQVYKTALESFSEHKYLNSIYHLNNLLTKHSQNAQLYINRGLCQVGLGNLNHAYSDLSKAIKIDHLNFVAYFNLASLKLGEEKHEKHERIIALQNLRRSLSCLYLKKFQRQNDSINVQKAIELYPHNAEALLIKGLKLSQEGKNHESLEYLQSINKFSQGQDQRIVQLARKVKQKIRESNKAQMKEYNPQVQKVSGKVIQDGQKQEMKQHELGRSQEDIDKQIDIRVQEWNNLYRDLYKDEPQKMSRLRQMKIDLSSGEEHLSTVWIMN